MRTVLLVTQDLNRAGAQRQCVELAKGLAARSGWRVEVAVLEPGGPLTSELQEHGIPIHACPRRWRWDLSPAAALARIAARSSAEVMHTFLFLPNFYGRVARLRHRPPLVVSSLRSTGIEGWPRYASEVLLAPLCDVIIANSDAGRNDLVRRGVAARRVVVVRNGMTFERFDGARAAGLPPFGDPLRLGMVAQMERRKDHAGLVAALARLRAGDPRVRLVLAGDGSLKDRIAEAARAHGVFEAIDWLGTVARPETVYATLHLYVQASAAEEGTSNSILEAMASGRPVLATDIGGNREVVADGETGLVVPPRDPAALARAAAALLADEKRARAMGEAAGRRVRERYDRSAMIEATIAVYEERLVARRGRGAVSA